jgi:glycosyltransferase involved in cell wall biosynthesis
LIPQTARLVVLTFSYPYGGGEPYLEDELKVVAPFLDQVLVTLPESRGRQGQDAANYLPENASVLLLDSELTAREKIGAWFGLFQPVVWEELAVFRAYTKAGWSLLTLKTLLSSYARARKCFRLLERALDERGLLVPGTALVSYWCTEYLMSLCWLRKRYPFLIVSTRLHAWDVYFERNAYGYLPFRKYLLRTIDQGLFISEHGKQYLSNRLEPLDPNRFRVRHLGVWAGVRRSVVPKPGVLRLLTLSFVSKVKRLERLVDALSLLPAQLTIEWTHIGDGNASYPDLQALAAKMQAACPNVSIRWMGHLSKAEVAQLLDSTDFDLLVNTSETEGLPVSMMEAFARGLPVLAPAIGGIPELVENGRNGWLLSSEPTPMEIAAALEFFLALDHREVAEVREAAYQTWADRFNAEQNYRQSLNDFFTSSHD